MKDLHEHAAEILMNREFMAEYNSLWGTTLGVETRTPMQREFDRAAGIRDVDALYKESELEEFIRFFERVIWPPAVQEMAS